MLVLVGCGARKLDHQATAERLYQGSYFRACLRTAKALAPSDAIRILSAKHGMVALDDRLDPYDVKMGDQGCADASLLRSQAVRHVPSLGIGLVLVLAGDAYASVAREVWPWADCPLRGLGIGQQLCVMAAMRRAQEHHG